MKRNYSYVISCSKPQSSSYSYSSCDDGPNRKQRRLIQYNQYNQFVSYAHHALSEGSNRNEISEIASSGNEVSDILHMISSHKESVEVFDLNFEVTDLEKVAKDELMQCENPLSNVQEEKMCPYLSALQRELHSRKVNDPTMVRENDEDTLMLIEKPTKTDANFSNSNVDENMLSTQCMKCPFNTNNKLSNSPRHNVQKLKQALNDASQLLKSQYPSHTSTTITSMKVIPTQCKPAKKRESNVQIASIPSAFVERNRKLDNSRCPMSKPSHISPSNYSYRKLIRNDRSKSEDKDFTVCPFMNLRASLPMSQIIDSIIRPKSLHQKIQTCLQCKLSHTKCSGWPKCKRCSSKNLPCYISSFHQQMSERIDEITQHIGERFLLDLFLPEEFLYRLEQSPNDPNDIQDPMEVLENEPLNDLENWFRSNSKQMHANPLPNQNQINGHTIRSLSMEAQENQHTIGTDRESPSFTKSMTKGGDNISLGTSSNQSQSTYTLQAPPTFSTTQFSPEWEGFWDQKNILPRMKRSISCGFNLVNQYYNTNSPTSVWAIEQKGRICPIARKTGTQVRKEVRKLVFCNDAFARMILHTKSELLNNQDAILELNQFTKLHIQKWCKWMPQEHLEPCFYGSIKVRIDNQYYLQKFERIYNLIFCVHLKIPSFDDEIELNGKVYPKTFSTALPLTENQSKHMVEKMEFILQELLQRCLEQMNMNESIPDL